MLLVEKRMKSVSGREVYSLGNPAQWANDDDLSSHWTEPALSPLSRYSQHSHTNASFFL